MQYEELYQLIENPGLLNEQTLPKLKELTIKHPSFQLARMLYVKNLKKTGSDEFETELKKVAIAVPDRKKLRRFLYPGAAQPSDYYLQQNTAGATDHPGAEPGEGSSLIDKFLSSDPAPIRMNNENARENSEEQENEIMEKSVSESDELITETLAMIYFEQKKYDKALDAFQKLSLKYPEKSVYFATRIEEIEKLKNI